MHLMITRREGARTGEGFLKAQNVYGNDSRRLSDIRGLSLGDLVPPIGDS
jgi:hypothetical protein